MPATGTFGGHAIRRSMAHSYRRKDIVGKRFLCVARDGNTLPAAAQRHRRPVSGAAAAHRTEPEPVQSPQCADEAHCPAQWKWRAGVVRAATHRHLFHKELQV